MAKTRWLYLESLELSKVSFYLSDSFVATIKQYATRLAGCPQSCKLVDNNINSLELMALVDHKGFEILHRYYAGRLTMSLEVLSDATAVIVLYDTMTYKEYRTERFTVQ